MRYQTSGAFRTALEQRLTTQSKVGGRSLSRLRKLVAFERMLARLAEVAPNRWVLKGGLALDLRLHERARTTIDVDIARQDDEEAAMHDFRAAERTELGDFFQFTIARTPHLDQADAAGAVRYRVRASLDGRLFEEFAIDVGFSVRDVPTPDVLEGTDLLAFAGLSPIRVPVLPLPRHIAEKVHAYTRRYGTRDQPSSRAKDLVDIALISNSATFVAHDLRTALLNTFADRATHPCPASLPEPPPEWRAQYRSLAAALGISADLAEGFRAAAAFLNPALGQEAGDTARWDPTAAQWRHSDTAER